MNGYWAGWVVSVNIDDAQFVFGSSRRSLICYLR